MWCCSFVYVSVENCCHNRASSHFWWLAWQRWCEDIIVAVSEFNPRVCSCFSSRLRTPGRGWPTSTGHQPVSGGRWPAADRGLTQPRCESRDTASTCSHLHRPRPLPMVSTSHIVSLKHTLRSLCLSWNSCPLKWCVALLVTEIWVRSDGDGPSGQKYAARVPSPILIALLSELPPYFYPISSTKSGRHHRGELLSYQF